MRSKSKPLSDQLRDIARLGVVNYKEDAAVLREAARRLDELECRCEEMEERIAIMAADQQQISMEELRFP